MKSFIIRCDGQTYRFDASMSAGLVDRTGTPLATPTPTPPLAEVIAACKVRMLLARKPHALIAVVWMVPINLPASWPILPDFALRSMLEAIERGNAILLLSHSEAALAPVIVRITAAVIPPRAV